MTPGALRSLLWALLSTGILVPAACLGKKGGGGAGEGRVESVDPREVVFSHAKIYGTFSCGRKVEDTLEQMRSAGLKAEALPRITLVEDHAADGSRVLLSLNNRRLYVLKAARELGLLPGGVVLCRIVPNGGRRSKVYSMANSYSKTATILASRKPQVPGSRDDTGAAPLED